MGELTPNFRKIPQMDHPWSKDRSLPEPLRNEDSHLLNRVEEHYWILRSCSTLTIDPRWYLQYGNIWQRFVTGTPTPIKNWYQTVKRRLFDARISRSREDVPNTELPLVIIVAIEDHTVTGFVVDDENSCKVLYTITLEQLGLHQLDLSPYKGENLLDFNNFITHPCRMTYLILLTSEEQKSQERQRSRGSRCRMENP